jgi:hypothetical protein
MSFLFHLSLLSGDYDPLLSLRLGSRDALVVSWAGGARTTHWLCRRQLLALPVIGPGVVLRHQSPEVALPEHPHALEKKITSPM